LTSVTPRQRPRSTRSRSRTAAAEIELDVTLEDGARATLTGNDDTPLPWERTAYGTRFELPEIPGRAPNSCAPAHLVCGR